MLSCISRPHQFNTFTAMDPDQCDFPPMKDLTADNITENVNTINSGAKNPRLRFLTDAIVRHLHDFARETRLSMAEWEYAVGFLAACGQKCSPTRQVCCHLATVAL